MDRTRVEADWLPLTLAEVRALLAEFPGCGEPIEILSVSPRPFSAASVVSTNSGRVFIKRHHKAVRDREGLLEEHRFLNHLYTCGAPVPRVFRIHPARQQSNAANGLMKCMKLPLAWIFMKTRFRGRRFVQRLMRGQQERCWRGCIWPR
jgi:hypothetical protein